MKHDKDHGAAFLQDVARQTKSFSSSTFLVDARGPSWEEWIFDAALNNPPNISSLDERYLTVAGMTDLPLGALASQILAVPEEAFPDGGPAKGISLWTKRREKKGNMKEKNALS